jgi:hypothetical protein
MNYPTDSEYRIDRVKLDGDLRDAYVELLSAQFAVDRLKLRYPPELVAMTGGSFLVNRSFTAALAIWEYFLKMQQYLAPGLPESPQDVSPEKPPGNKK